MMNHKPHRKNYVVSYEGTSLASIKNGGHMLQDGPLGSGLSLWETLVDCVPGTSLLAFHAVFQNLQHA